MYTPATGCIFCSTPAPEGPEAELWCQPYLAGARRLVCPACCRCDRARNCGAHTCDSDECLHCFCVTVALLEGATDADEIALIAEYYETDEKASRAVSALLGMKE